MICKKAAAEADTIHVIINGLHPYFISLEDGESINECIRQYIYDAIAEYKTAKMTKDAGIPSIRDGAVMQLVRLTDGPFALRTPK